MQPAIDTINDIVTHSKKIVIIQAENPDADSLGSALALEHILGDLGKIVTMFCSVEMPGYLRYLKGWDRVENVLPKEFDASIIVDASTSTLFEKLLYHPNNRKILSMKPCIVLDHHSVVDHEISFATVIINDPSRASTGELIFMIANELTWNMTSAAQEYIMSSILGDTQGLTNQLASSETYRIMAAMIDKGVSRPKLEELRRQYGKMPTAIYRYKANLILHTEFSSDNRIANVMIPQIEINKYSPLYNPAPLILGDMLQVSDVLVAIVFKRYDDGRITAAIRCNPGAPIAAELAQHFNGGGHEYAGGFKYISSKSYEVVKEECLQLADTLLNKTVKGESSEAVQYTF